MLNQILESLPDIVLVVGRDGAIRYINRVEVGYKRDEVIGMHWLAVIFPEARERLQEAYEAVVAGGRARGVREQGAGRRWRAAVVSRSHVGVS